MMMTMFFFFSIAHAQKGQYAWRAQVLTDWGLWSSNAAFLEAYHPVWQQFAREVQRIVLVRAGG
jgi:hypothetical protein